MILSLNLSGIRGWDSVFPVSKNNNRKNFYSSPMWTRFPAALRSFTRAASQFIPSDEQYAEHKRISLSLWKWATEPAYSMTWTSCNSFCLTTAAAGIRNTEDQACASWTMREKPRNSHGVTSTPLSPRSSICWITLMCNTEGKLWINW